MRLNFSSLSIGLKMAVLGAIIVLFSLYQFYMVYTDKMAIVDFTKKEIAGALYIQDIRPVLAKLDDRVANLKKNNFSAADVTLVQNSDQTYGMAKSVDVQSFMKDFLASFSPLVDKSDATEEEVEKAMDAMQEYLSKLVDASNLSLDPDIDSYYLINIAFVAVPDVQYKIADLEQHLTEHLDQKVPFDVKKQMKLTVLKGQYSEILTNIEAYYANALGGNGALIKEKIAPLMADVEALSGIFLKDYEAFLEAADQLTDKGGMGTPETLALAQKAFVSSENLINAYSKLQEETTTVVMTLLNTRIQGLYNNLYFQFSIALILVFMCVIAGIYLRRNFFAALDKLLGLSDQVLADQKIGTIPYQDRGDEIGNIARTLNQIITLGQESARIRTALDSVDGSVLIADVHNTIVYLNPSMARSFQRSQQAIKNVVPDFDSAHVLGQNIDIFQKRAGITAESLKNQTSSTSGTLQFGETIVDVTFSPVMSKDGERLGTAVQWVDVTQERKIEAEIESVVVAAVAGDFTKKLMVEGRKGFILKLCEGINKVTETSLTGLTEVTNSLQAIAAGNLTTKVTGQYQGMFDEIKQALNATLDTLDHIITEINVTADAAAQGDFTKRLDLQGQQGSMLDLCQGMNQICEVSQQGLTDLQKALQSLSQGDLRVTMEGNYKGQFATIQSALNETIGQLRDMVTQINRSADSVTTASRDILNGSKSLAMRSEQQAANLEETAASMEQLTATVRLNTDNAQQASSNVEDAQKVANKGGEIVKLTIDAMSKIQESSEKISDVISVIDDIAFQTNLLALNAAVEAARAGDAGKGFAVVASEVRSLAGSSADASKQIKGLIGISIDQVREGVDLVSKSGKSLQDIVQSVNGITTIIAQIARASQEQASGLEEINSAVTQMDQMTQKNASLVTESASSSEFMSQQAVNMAQLMRFFKI